MSIPKRSPSENIPPPDNTHQNFVTPLYDIILRHDRWLMLGLLILLSFLIFNKFILGYALYLFTDIGSDVVNAAYPHWISISDTLRSGKLPSWSFEKGMGQNLFPFSLNDPFTYILYFMDSKNIPFAIIWIELVKINISGLLFFCFLRKIKISKIPSLIGGLLYAFSGFMIIGSSWYFSISGIHTALLLLSFEMLYQDKKAGLFTFTIALIAMRNPFMLYTSGVFLFFYALYSAYINVNKSLSEKLNFLFKIILYTFIGILVSSVISLPELMEMINSPRVNGDASLTSDLFSLPIFETGSPEYLVTLIMRTFSNDILGNGNAFTGWRNYLESPLSYCGLLSLLLVTQNFFLPSKRIKVASFMLISVFIFAEIFPWFRRAYWLFTGDYFRDFSLFLSILFILFSLTVLDDIIKHRNFNWPVLIFTLCALLVLLFFPYQSIISENNLTKASDFKLVINKSIQIKITLYLLLIIVILFLITHSKYSKRAQLYLLTITFIELWDFGHASVAHRHFLSASQLSQRVGYNDYTVEAIAHIKNQDNGFYRIEKTYSAMEGELPGHASLNDSMVYHYFGTTSYTSFNQSNYINFLIACSTMDLTEKSGFRWSVGVVNDPLLSILVGVKYLLFKGDLPANSPISSFYTEMGSIENIHLLKSKYALPMGVAYDTYILESDFMRLDKYHKHIALLKAVMIPDKMAYALLDMKKITAADLPKLYPSNELASDTKRLKENSLSIVHFSNDEIYGTISSQINRLVFFSFPFDKGWAATVNGQSTPIYLVNGGLSAVPINVGTNTIALKYTPPFVTVGLYLSLCGLFMLTVLSLHGYFQKLHRPRANLAAKTM